MSVSGQITRIGNAIGSSFAAIIAKGVDVKNINSPDSLSPDIASISTNGLNNLVGRDVIFIDYDGTEVATYSAETFQRLTALPPNPKHDGLVAQGWNWTLDQINNQLSKVGGKVVVGQMYTTQSGASEIDCIIPEERKDIALDFGVNGTATIDWGDGTTETTTGISLGTHQNKRHVYLTGGQYTIKIVVQDGDEMAFINHDGSLNLINGKHITAYASAYFQMIKAVRVGKNVISFDHDAFHDCGCLETITIPNTVVEINSSNLFYRCYSLNALVLPTGVEIISDNLIRSDLKLKYISIPPSVTSIGDYICYDDRCIEAITIPYGVTTLGVASFQNIEQLISIVVPNTVTKIKQSCFKNCVNVEEIILQNNQIDIDDSAFGGYAKLKSVVWRNNKVPSNAFNQCSSLSDITLIDVTEIRASAFYQCCSISSINLPEGLVSILNNAFNGCISLYRVDIPSTVTKIESGVFIGNRGIMEYHLLPESPPTLDNIDAFQDIASSCIIYVPYSEDHSILNAYQTATNWSTYSNYMQEEPQ